MLPLRQTVLVTFAIVEAVHHGFYQRLLETARRLGLGDDFGGVLRQLLGRGVQPLEPCQWHGAGVRYSGLLGGVRSQPAIAPTETISSTGSDMEPKEAAPDNC